MKFPGFRRKADFSCEHLFTKVPRCFRNCPFYMVPVSKPSDVRPVRRSSSIFPRTSHDAQAAHPFLQPGSLQLIEIPAKEILPGQNELVQEAFFYLSIQRSRCRLSHRMDFCCRSFQSYRRSHFSRFSRSFHSYRVFPGSSPGHPSFCHDPSSSLSVL